ncbi:hypothetical protein AXF42_Ash008223 [Apostasia shenzhenica]|uniref:Uncharacterized protein n=1 Tax=Apostasia shenzhenica TaxID=1088818 RepID=A0A2I0A8Y2_9ASPA|nr:hypothetical protein AXF42_Ash008223 [Apostasia shenzhenica]
MPNFTLSASFPSLHQAVYEHEWSGGECMVRLSCLPAARRAAGSISIIIRERHQMLPPPPPAACQLPREPEPIPQSVFFVTLNLYSSSSTSRLMSYADIKLAVSTATRRAAAFLEHKILKFLNQKISLFAAEEGRSSTYAVNAIAEVVYTYNNKEEEEFHELMMTSARENEEVRKMVEKMTAEMKMEMMKLKVGEIIRDNLGSSGSSSMSRLEEE